MLHQEGLTLLSHQWNDVFFKKRNNLYDYVIFNIIKTCTITVTIWLMRSHYYWQMTENWLPLLSRSFLDVFYFDKVEQLLFLRLWLIFQTWIKRNLLASPNTEQWTLIKPTVISETKAIILAGFHYNTYRRQRKRRYCSDNWTKSL